MRSGKRYGVRGKDIEVLGVVEVVVVRRHFGSKLSHLFDGCKVSEWC